MRHTYSNHRQTIADMERAQQETPAAAMLACACFVLSLVVIVFL